MVSQSAIDIVRPKLQLDFSREPMVIQRNTEPLKNIEIIYAAGGNSELSVIAYEEGWRVGTRSDKWHAPLPITFLDIDYKSKNMEKLFEQHLARAAKERPFIATVPDLSDKVVDDRDISRAVNQAIRLADYCRTVLVVPKLTGQIEMLPPGLAIGYSIPTSYGGAQYPIWELAGRRVHLLGGNPHEQIKLYRYISAIGKVISVDGNFAQKMALEYCMYWTQSGRVGGQWHRWPVVSRDQQYPCFRLSCQNILKAWQKETAQAA